MEENNEKIEEQKNPRDLLCYLSDIFTSIALTVTVVMVVFCLVCRLSVVDGSSMEKTLQDGQYLVVWSLGYTPTDGDIVILEDKSAYPYDVPLVKRVIATEGETITIDFNTWNVYIDGELIDESDYRYLDPDHVVWANYNVDTNNVFTYTIPDGKVFVMGDNRHNSGDSRQLSLGAVDKRCVVGKVVLRITPLDKITVFKNPYND